MKEQFVDPDRFLGNMHRPLNDTAPCENVISGLEALRDLYREPSEGAAQEDRRPTTAAAP